MEHSHAQRPRFVGRREPLAALVGAIEAAASGTGRFLLLSGEPGIGKTRLAEEAAAVASQSAIPSFWGRCYELEGRPPYWPWVQILRDVGARTACNPAGNDDLWPLAHWLHEDAGRRRAADGTADDRVLDSETARFRLFQGTDQLLRELTAERPALLVFDDLHWADVASLRLLEYLAHDTGSRRLIVVATFREADVRHNPAAGEIIGRLARHAHSISLGGLSADEVADFVAGSRGADLSASWAARLHAITDGNPFFVDEMLRLIAARGDVFPDPHTPLPHGVVAAIRERLRGLPPATMQRLAQAAIVRREFDLGLLEAVLGETRAVLDDLLREACERDVIRALPDRPGRFRFAHALMHQVIAAELPAAQRAELHRRCATVLERRHANSLDAYVAEIAHHYAEAALQGFDAKALDFCERAADQASRNLAFDEAAALYSRAIGLLDQAPTRDLARRAELLLALSEATNRAGQGARAAQALEEAAAIAREIDAPVALARAAIGLCSIGSTWAQYGRSDPALIRILGEAQARLDPREVGLQAKIQARLATELHFAPEPEDTAAMSSRAVTLARRDGDARTLIETLPARLRCSGPGDAAERREIIDELLRLSGGRGEVAVHAYVWKLSEALQAGDATTVEACREQLRAAVSETRLPRDTWLLAALDGQAHLRAGRLAEAERAVDAILGHEGLTANGEMAALVLLFLIRREQGRLAELADGMRDFAARSSTATAWRTNLALLNAETGNEAAARSEVDALVADELPALRRDNTWLLGVAGLAGATAAVGSPAQAEIVFRVMLPFAGRHVVAASIFYVGPVTLQLGLLAQRAGRIAAARQYLADACAAARALGSPPFVARALLARAATSPRPESAAELAEAFQIADELGLAAIAAAARHAGSAAAAAERAPLRARLAWGGTAWTLVYRERSSVVKALRGMDYLATLLASPGTELHALDLARPTRAGAARPTGDGDAWLDPRAKRELAERVRELRSDLAQAEEHRDLGRAERVREEIEAVTEHLAKATGLGGRARRASGDGERARAAVTKAIRSAIRTIAHCEPDLAEVLSKSVRTGRLCSYQPLAELPVAWSIEPRPPRARRTR